MLHHFSRQVAAIVRKTGTVLSKLETGVHPFGARVLVWKLGKERGKFGVSPGLFVANRHYHCGAGALTENSQEKTGTLTTLFLLSETLEFRPSKLIVSVESNHAD